MVEALEKAVAGMRAVADAKSGNGGGVDSRCLLAVCLLYLVAMLSVPLSSLSVLILFAIYPVVESASQGVGYGRILKRSLVVLPFVAFIGVFSPVYHRRPLFTMMGMTVTAGCVEFISIVLRGMLSVQALLLLVGRCGFAGMCRAMERVGVPGFMTTQLLFVYRYIWVLMHEALCMCRAREARGYGNRHLSMRMWGMFAGQLFLRSVERSKRVHSAMLARGFTGVMPPAFTLDPGWRAGDTVRLLIWAGVFAALRFINIPEALNLPL